MENDKSKQEKRREYMQQKRQQYTPEQKELNRAKSREYMRNKRSKDAAFVESEREKNKVYMQTKRKTDEAFLSSEREKNKVYMQTKRKTDEVFVTSEREKNKEYMQTKRNEAFIASEQETQTTNRRNIQENNRLFTTLENVNNESTAETTNTNVRKKRKTSKQQTNNNEENSSNQTDNFFSERHINSDGETTLHHTEQFEIIQVENEDNPDTMEITEEDILECSTSFQEKINRTERKSYEDAYDENIKIHQSLVCVICDRFIIGMDSVHWVNKEILMFHENVLSSSYFYQDGINPLLQQQYTLDDDELNNLLLSPRARKNIQLNAYMCCSCCKLQLNLDMKKKRTLPPKYAISNGFAIGSLPETILVGNTPVINNLVAPIRAFNFFLVFSHCQEQKITGNFTFFSQDVSENIGALRHTASINNSSCVYVLLHGAFTPIQLEKIRKLGIYNVDTFVRVYQFLHMNNPLYENLPSVDELPIPLVEEINLSGDTVENSHDLEGSSDNHITWKYWFPSVGDPNTTNGNHNNQSEFAKAIWTGETPTLIYHPSKVLYNATLTELCPTAFPFGVGGVEVDRKPHVSELECLQHYLKLSLPLFSEGQIILIIHHMYQRRKSFVSGITKCNQIRNGISLSDSLSEITEEELDDIITQMKNANSSVTYSQQLQTSTRITELLKTIRTSCIPIGYSNEAAFNARNNMFALWMTFGPPALLFTFSPCDECSINMQLFATSKETKLLSLKDNIELLSSNLSLRKSLRVKFPGAAAREFDNLFQIVVSQLLGWGRYQKKGIFGRLQAYSSAIEEQGRTSLHAHTILWIHGFNNMYNKIFSTQQAEREQAILQLQRYMETILCTTFNIQGFDVKKDMSHNSSTCEGNIEGVTSQQLRKMRHRHYLKESKGNIIKCSTCDTYWNTYQIINEYVQNMLPTAKEECPEFGIEHLTLPLDMQQVETLALRYRYDMISLPKTAVTMRRLLHNLMILFFNTHDWKHRKGCFKKGKECRFKLPQLPCEQTNLRFNKEDNNIQNICDTIQSSNTVDWYFIDGTSSPVCNFEVESKRQAYDVFVNAHNHTISDVLGYNNNICLGSINTLYYCTLYSSKTNQEEETYPYQKACEAVLNRMRRSNALGNESTLSNRQIGLRRLLSGIHANLSSCVVSATMAWYLVVHGNRFQYSHEFRPLLLSQLEAWFHNETLTQRIRSKRQSHESQRTTTELDEACNEVWFDAAINNYLFRPETEEFNNLSIWEFHCLYEVKGIKPSRKMGKDDERDGSGTYFKFKKGHPGYLYSCLEKKAKGKTIVPKLYYSTKFPDVETLHIGMDHEVGEHIKEQRELYALKALLLFMPFRSREDLKRPNHSLWESFILQQNKLQQLHYLKPHMYKRFSTILQNIQNMFNIKKIPPSKDQLDICTESLDKLTRTSRSEASPNIVEEDSDFSDDPIQADSHIEAIMTQVNECIQTASIFNNQQLQIKCQKLQQIRSLIFPLCKPNIEDSHYNGNNGTNEVQSIEQPSRHMRSGTNSLRTLVTIVTKTLNIDDIVMCPISQTDDEQFDLPSMEQFVSQNHLDPKQQLAFQVICSSFILTYLLDSDVSLPNNLQDILKQQLIKKGAVQQLLMCVTGPGGSGKSHVIKCCQSYCKRFCTMINKPFDYSVFPITATSNSAASLLKGKTIHTAALINNKRVAIEYSTVVDWTSTRILIIDEISMAGISLLIKLDKNLRILTGKRSLLYGGLHIVFMGDFMQLSPVGYPPIYRKTDDIHWHGSLNAAVFLDQGNHRFNNDLEWGTMLNRIQIGKPTDEDLLQLNSRLIKTDEVLQEVNCISTRIVYGCFSNKRRNEITDSCFLDFITRNHPEFHSNIDPPECSLLIKSSISKDKCNVGEELCKFIWGLCGDSNLDDGASRKIDPCLKLILGCPLMLNNNTDKDKNLTKGTVGNYLGVRWKQGCNPHIEDFHGYKVFAAYESDIDYLLMITENDKKVVELKAETVTVNITITMDGLQQNPHVLKDYSVCQFPVNLSLATTGHKLQGMTKDILILSEVSTNTPNWLYVVLSRVTTLKGLYLMIPLTKSMFKPISKEIQQELEFLRNLEKQVLDRISEQ